MRHGAKPLFGWPALLLSAPLLAFAHPVGAQPRFGPGEERPELEEFEPDEAPPSPLELPPIPPPIEVAPDRLSAGRAVFIRAFEIEGSTVFGAEELGDAVASYTGRAISSEELLDAKEAITAYYAERGYVTSGAVIPDQTVENGVVRIEIVEGGLTDVRVEGARWFRPRYFRDRLMLAGGPPVNAARLERVLQRFQRNPRVVRVDARLVPGARRGESILLLAVEEMPRMSVGLAVANDEPPSIGGVAGHFSMDFPNILGVDDIVSGTIAVTEGLREYDLFYTLPINAYDTTLGLEFIDSDSEVVEFPIDVTSRSRTYGITLRHPLLRQRGQELWLGLTGERRQSESKLFGVTTCFQSGVFDCTPVVSVLRVTQDWNYRSRSDVLAARSTLSIGIPVLGATTSGSSELPDSQFVAWLGQLQWAHVIPRWWQSELLFRVDTQLANDPLLALEKFALGGMRTVRGYRENELVRDNAVVASLELRIPVLRDPVGRPLVQLAPFADFGRGWDNEIGLSSDNLASLGVGLRLAPWDWLRGEFYWGGRLTRTHRRGDDLQDHGFHFRVTVTPAGLVSPRGGPRRRYGPK